MYARPKLVHPQFCGSKRFTYEKIDCLKDVKVTEGFRSKEEALAAMLDLICSGWTS